MTAKVSQDDQADLAPTAEELAKAERRARWIETEMAVRYSGPGWQEHVNQLARERRRAKEGRQRAAAEARAAVRPKSADPAIVGRVDRLHRQRDLSAAAIAKIVDLDPRTVRAILKKLGHT